MVILFNVMSRYHCLLSIEEKIIQEHKKVNRFESFALKNLDLIRFSKKNSYSLRKDKA